MIDFILKLLSHLLGIAAVSIAAFWGAKCAIDELLDVDCDDCECGCSCDCKHKNKEE